MHPRRMASPWSLVGRAFLILELAAKLNGKAGGCFTWHAIVACTSVTKLPRSRTRTFEIRILQMRDIVVRYDCASVVPVLCYEYNNIPK